MLRRITPPTIIAEGSCLRGDTIFFSITHVFGIIDGDVHQQTPDPIQVGKSGWVSGNIVSQGAVVIEGRVDGEVRSQSKVVLLSSANVRGKIIAPAVNVQAGALLNGEISTTTSAPSVATLRAIPQAA